MDRQVAPSPIGHKLITGDYATKSNAKMVRTLTTLSLDPVKKTTSTTVTVARWVHMDLSDRTEAVMITQTAQSINMAVTDMGTDEAVTSNKAK